MVDHKCEEIVSCVFDDSMSMIPHITAVCKSAFFHLRNISMIRKEEEEEEEEFKDGCSQRSRL